MKQTIKRLMALLLAMAMSLSLIGRNAWAAEVLPQAESETTSVEMNEEGAESVQSDDDASGEESAQEEDAAEESAQKEDAAEESAQKEEETEENSVPDQSCEGASEEENKQETEVTEQEPVSDQSSEEEAEEESTQDSKTSGEESAPEKEETDEDDSLTVQSTASQAISLDDAKSYVSKITSSTVRDRFYSLFNEFTPYQNGSTKINNATSGSYWTNKINTNITSGSRCGGAWQCFGFALYCYSYMFHCLGSPVNTSDSNMLLHGATTASYESFNNAGVKPGAHIRCVSSETNNTGHSMILVYYDPDYIVVYHANGDDNGTVYAGRYTWAQFNSAQMGGHSPSRHLYYVAMPKNYPDDVSILDRSQTISDGEYHIVSCLSDTQTINVAGDSNDDGANVQLWSTLEQANQVFRVSYLGDGYYKIINTSSGKSLDVDGAGMLSGTNIQQWTYVGADQQQWVIRETGDGQSYYIVSKHNGLYLDAEGGASDNGTNVRCYEGNGTNAQKWRFVAWGATTGQTISNGRYHVVSGLDNSKALDVAGGSRDNNANIQIYSNISDDNQLFDVKYLGNGYYQITNTSSGKSLDCAGAGTYAKTNIQQYSYDASDQQKWIIKEAGNGYYFIISKKSGMYLDVANGISENGANVWLFLGNSSQAQKWKFFRDNTPSTISDVRVTNVTSSSYTISCKVSDNVGVTSVRFPTWTVKNGQDDLGDWPIGTINNGVASYTVKSSEHKNETNCAYATHIYAYDTAGNATCVEVNEIWMMSPSKTIPDGRYHIGSKMNSSTTVTVGGESKAEGGNINLWNSYDTANQCFDISYLNNGYYKIINTNSGMALTADNGALTDGNVIQHSYTGSDDQQWAILNVGDGIYFELVPRANFLVRLDAQGAVPDNGTNIVVHTKNNYKNQRWCFAPWIPSTNVDYINGIVTFAGKELTEGIDYACERIANGVSITVKIIGKKPYASGMVSETLTDPFVVMLSQNYYFFDGTPKEPFTLVYIDGRLLENTRDYDVSYSNNVACGEATATIQFKGQYQGYNSRYEHERRVGFRIDKMSVSQCHVALSQNCLFFDGSQKRPSVIINNGNKELILNTDYTVSYGENTSPGTGTVKITGKGNYQGETIVGFSIQPSNLDDCTIDLSEKSYFYDGSPKLPAVTLKNGETPLIKGRDYEVSYQNNIQAGTASVLVTGKGGYTGTRGATFVIMPNRITDYVISPSEKTFIYDGAAKVPEVTIGNEEKTLNKGLDYEVSYRNNVNAGTATAIVIGKGIYSGKVEIPFTISKASNALSASMSNDSLHEKETAQITATGHGTIIYQSSDEGIATVNSSGVVTGKSVGTATIVVSAEDDPNYQSASKSVTITVTHDYDSGTVTQKATCTEDGMKTFTCRVCGKTNAEVIPAVGHSYEATVVPPTCTERGYTTHTCKNCNDTYEDSFTEALGHNFDNGEVTQEPTGDTPGVKTYVCSRCEATKTETIPAKGHHYDAGQVTEKASCTQDGIRTYTCTDAGCGKTYTEVIPATGHQYESVVTQPTCTKKGYTTHTCSVCTDSYRDNYVDALGHKYDNGTILEKPSCEEEGLKEFTCTRCKKASYTVVIPAAGHNYTEDTTAPTCTKKGYTTHTCSVCKSSYKDQFTDAIGHHFDEGKVVEEATCKEEGLVEYTCSKCKMTKTETIPVDKDHHTGSTQMKNRKEATCGKSGYSGDVYCNDCGKMIAEGKMISATEEHTWDDGIVFQEATCCSQGKKILTCSGCGDLKMEVLPIDSSNHVHTQIRGSRKATCVAAGYSGDTWCEDCNQKVSAGEEIAVDPSNHVGETEIRESKWATCAQEGYSGDTYCSSCGEKLSDGKTIPATGEHVWDAGTVTKDASCRENGEKTFTCTVCQETKTEEVPLNPANHTGGTEIRNRKTATCGKDGFTGDTYCLDCGEKLSSGQTTPATGKHIWDGGSVTTQPTTKTEGVKTYKCTVCGQTRTESVAKLPQPQPQPEVQPEPVPAPVEKTANTITVKDFIFRTYNKKKDQSFNLGAKANGAPLSYKSSNKKVTVKNGKVTVKKGFMGQATITVTASETAKYKKAQKKITLMVGPSGTQLSSVKYDAKKKVINAAWKKNTTGKGYEIQISLKKDFKKVYKKVKINKNATVKTAIKGMKKGTYYVRIRTINGKTYSDWSKTKTVKVK